MKQQNWEIKFDEKFNTIDHTGIIWGKNNKVTMSLEAIKQFIASLLEEQKKELVKDILKCLPKGGANSGSDGWKEYDEYARWNINNKLNK